MNIDISNLTVYSGQNIKDWIDILSALLTPVIAILTVTIAFFQWQTNEKKRKQDLFDMRYDKLYFPIFICTERIRKIKEEDLSLDEKGKQIQNEISDFWRQFCKYKFLITNEDREKLQKHYNYILEIIQKYDYKNKDITNNAEEFLSVFALMCHLMSMETILAKYLSIEPDTFYYRTKCRISNLKNRLFPNKLKEASQVITENKNECTEKPND